MLSLITNEHNTNVVVRRNSIIMTSEEGSKKDFHTFVYIVQCTVFCVCQNACVVIDNNNTQCVCAKAIIIIIVDVGLKLKQLVV